MCKILSLENKYTVKKIMKSRHIMEKIRMTKEYSIRCWALLTSTEVKALKLTSPSLVGSRENPCILQGHPQAQSHERVYEFCIKFYVHLPNTPTVSLLTIFLLKGNENRCAHKDIWETQWGIMGVNMITQNQKQTKGPPTSKSINTWNPQDKGLPRIPELPETQPKVAGGTKAQSEESSRKMPDRSPKNNNNNTHARMKHFFAQCSRLCALPAP